MSRRKPVDPLQLIPVVDLHGQAHLVMRCHFFHGADRFLSTYTRNGHLKRNGLIERGQVEARQC